MAPLVPLDHALADLLVEPSGQRPVGPWVVDWGRGAGAGGRRTPERLRLTVAAPDGEPATVTALVRDPPPLGLTVHRGVELETSWAETIEVRRNGMRPVAALRRVTIRSPRRAWTAAGQLVGTVLVDDADGAVLARTVGGAARVDLARPAPDVALVLALLALAVPQRLALTGFRTSP